MIEAAHQRAVDKETIGVHGMVYNRHCERSEAIHRAARMVVSKNGLLRCARNDARGTLYAATTSSLTTTNFTRSMRPKLVVSATSAASRPVPIRMRPIRGGLWRGVRRCRRRLQITPTTTHSI